MILRLSGAWDVVLVESTERLGFSSGKRVAVLSPGALVGMQTQRAIAFPNLRRFRDQAEARAWLAEGRGEAD